VGGAARYEERVSRQLQVGIAGAGVGAVTVVAAVAMKKEYVNIGGSVIVWILLSGDSSSGDCSSSCGGITTLSKASSKLFYLLQRLLLLQWPSTSNTRRGAYRVLYA
jgi:hypothetical protein